MSIVKEALFYVAAATYLFFHIAFWAGVATLPVVMVYAIGYSIEYYMG
tara:strand:+ start:119 stop:262 length:144 start_codon:yes stop_codon:yes gene_type:complete